MVRMMMMVMMMVMMMLMMMRMMMMMTMVSDWRSQRVSLFGVRPSPDHLLYGKYSVISRAAQAANAASSNSLSTSESVTSWPLAGS